MKFKFHQHTHFIKNTEIEFSFDFIPPPQSSLILIFISLPPHWSPALMILLFMKFEVQQYTHFIKTMCTCVHTFSPVIHHCYCFFTSPTLLCSMGPHNSTSVSLFSSLLFLQLIFTVSIDSSNISQHIPLQIPVVP